MKNIGRKLVFRIQGGILVTKEFKQIAVLGGGNGGWAFAGDLALAGFDVNLFDFPEFYDESLAPLEDFGGIEMAGVGREGFAELNMITSDLEEALDGVQVILIAAPSFAHAEFAKSCAPYLTEGQIIVLNPGYTFGAIEFSNVVAREGFDIEKITICETASLLYAARKYLPNKVFCGGVKTRLPFAAFPGENTEEANEILQDIFIQSDKERGQIVPVKNVLMNSLLNTNPPGHVPMMLLKAVYVEQGEEPYVNCDESGAVQKLKQAISQKFLDLQKALGFPLMSFQYIHHKLFYPPGAPLHELIINPDYEGGPEWAIKENQPEIYATGRDINLLEMRYLTEDVPYALAGFSTLGDMLGVKTPVIDSCIEMASVITGRDFWQEGRTTQKVGISHFSKSELLNYVNKGTIN